jgi:hypothetical protein
MSFRQEVWTFASGGDLLGSLDSVHIPHPRVDLREQVRRIQPAEAALRQAAAPYAPSSRSRTTFCGSKRTATRSPGAQPASP